MEVIYQPFGSTSCGQHCVAMLSKKDIKDVIKLFGHSHSTTTKEMVTILNTLGFNTDSKLRIITRELNIPKLGLIKIKWVNGKSHWVIVDDLIIYCPLRGTYPITLWPYGLKGKFSSFLKIQPNEKN